MTLIYSICKHKTEACKCTLVNKALDTLCIQLIKFSNHGVKVKTLVEYPEIFSLEEMAEFEIILVSEEYMLVPVMIQLNQVITLQTSSEMVTLT